MIGGRSYVVFIGCSQSAPVKHWRMLDGASLFRRPLRFCVMFDARGGGRKTTLAPGPRGLL